MSEANSRLISLDVFRGMTIAGMVLVNNPGSWSHIYAPLEHAEWNGLTPTDWIFPFFLFIVGVAIPIALSKRIAEGITGKVYRKIVSRAAAIYLLGAAISIIPFFSFSSTDAPDWEKMLIWLVFSAALYFLMLRNYKLTIILTAVGVVGVIAMYLAGYSVGGYNFGTLRIFGVLQRIAVCYLITSIIFLHTTWKQQLGITSFNDKACNLAAWLDRTILTEDHIWRQAKVYDPEGLLSTIPAIVTTIAGVLTGTWLMRRDKGHLTVDETSDQSLVDRYSSLDKVAGMFFAGVVLLAIGFIWNSYFPINKSLWTSSFVCATAGLALLTLGSCYWLIDIKGYKTWARPFVIFGANALALFVFTGLFARMIGAYHVTGADGKPTSIQQWIFDNVFSVVLQPIDASLAFAICFILLWLFLMWLLYRKQIYIKV
ncbi:MAG: DUF5009 domain-containing protein [Acidobacteriota bacterium]